MAQDQRVPVSELGEAEAFALLSSAPVGRLAVSVGGVVDVFPVNHVVDGRTVLFRTSQGGKLVELTINARVAFESDGWDDVEAWSVVVKGHARVLESVEEIAHADSLGLAPWAHTPKTVWVAIGTDEISGRRVRRDVSPDDAWA